jgi:glycosyltransferase involved in cell wall biosynthesis
MKARIEVNFVTTEPEDFAIIRSRYLAVQNIPYFIDAFGRVLLERSWHHDLIEHLRYLPHFTLAAPLRPLPSNADHLVPLEDSLRARLKLVALPPLTTRIQALLQLPATALVLWRTIGQADIVHSSIGGWPYPLGWLANPIAQVRGKKRLVIVESAAWRTADKKGTIVPLRRRLEIAVYELLARRWCSTADLSFYTQPAYLAQFHGGAKRPAYVKPASWVKAEDVLGDTQARALWDEKMKRPVRFLFAGRLVVEKGVRILLEAVEKLAAAGMHGTIHVIGQGPLRNEVAAKAQSHPFGLIYFEPISYGGPFLTFLQQYHAVVVPSLSDEQPRIVFDAAARAVPILASETDGLRPHVENGRTGLLIPPGDPRALAEAMAQWVDKPAPLRGFGMEALRRVRNQTHRAMHAERSRIIARHLGAG